MDRVQGSVLPLRDRGFEAKREGRRGVVVVKITGRDTIPALRW